MVGTSELFLIQRKKFCCIKYSLCRCIGNVENQVEIVEHFGADVPYSMSIRGPGARVLGIFI